MAHSTILLYGLIFQKDATFLKFITNAQADLEVLVKEGLKLELRWLKTVSSTFQDLQFDGSL